MTIEELITSLESGDEQDNKRHEDRVIALLRELVAAREEIHLARTNHDRSAIVGIERCASKTDAARRVSDAPQLNERRTMGEPYHVESWRTRQGKERWWVKDSAGRLVGATAGGLNRQRVSDLCAALNEAFRAGVRTAQASRPRITVDDHTPPSESGICP